MTGRWTEWRLPPGLLLRKCEGERKGVGRGGRKGREERWRRKAGKEKERKEGRREGGGGR